MSDFSKGSIDDNIKDPKSKKRKTKNKATVLMFRAVTAVLLIILFAVVGAAAGAYIAIIRDTPTNFDMYVVEPDKYTTLIVDQNGVETGHFSGEENRENVNFSQVPENLKNAFIAIEDERFYSHNGIDIKGIFRSLYVLLTRHDTQGASTITQQVIKINISKRISNNFETKIKEQYLAVKYESFLKEKLGSKRAAKNYILETYLNSIAMNHGLYGVATSAEYYFGKDVKDLDLAECAVLAGITNNPSRYSPDTNKENNKVRQTAILNKMLELKMISKSQHDEALAEDVYSHIGNVRAAENEDTVKTYHSFYEDQIFESVLADLIDIGYDKATATAKIYSGGLKIVSAQDAEIQKIIDDAYLDDKNFPEQDYEIDVLYIATIKNSSGENRNIEVRKTVKTDEAAEDFVVQARADNVAYGEEIIGERIEKTPEPQSAFALIDYHNGEVKAIAGGRGVKQNDRAFNRATAAERSPGSAFKPLASYAPAVDLGLVSPSSVYDDVPFTVGRYSPSNWDFKYIGYTRVRYAIAHSMNVIAVKNMYATGIDKCFDYLKNFGFTTLVESDRGLSTALGGLTYGVTQVELAAAYGTIANGGYYNKPVFYTKVYDHDGEILLENTMEQKQVLKATSAYLLTDMLKGVINGAGGTGGKAAFKKLKMPVAGKTGTTSDANDLVFAGFTPYYVASVWLGFDQQKPIKHGAGDHLSLWSKIMEEVHVQKGLEPKEFVKPDGIVTATVCRYSGKLPVYGLCDADPRGSALVTDIFAAGNVPTESCDVHAQVEMDTSTNMKANMYCPSQVLETRIGITRRPQDAGRAGDSQYEVSTEVCTFHNMYNSNVVPPRDDLPVPPDLSDFPTDTGNDDVPSDLDIFMPPDR
ncbi:penicillin-binding protein [Clostridia bacterium]|nr:penicillin-binding protein [Clostridia bacterium]